MRRQRLFRASTGAGASQRQIGLRLLTGKRRLLAALYPHPSSGSCRAAERHPILILG
jgi:hypothetical protein